MKLRHRRRRMSRNCRPVTSRITADQLRRIFMKLELAKLDPVDGFYVIDLPKWK